MYRICTTYVTISIQEISCGTLWSAVIKANWRRNQRVILRVVQVNYTQRVEIWHLSFTHEVAGREQEGGQKDRKKNYVSKTIF